MSELKPGDRVWIEAIVSGSDEGEDPTVELKIDTGGITETVYAFRSRLSTSAPISSDHARILEAVEEWGPLAGYDLPTSLDEEKARMRVLSAWQAKHEAGFSTPEEAIIRGMESAGADWHSNEVADIVDSLRREGWLRDSSAGDPS